jgi:hypothetical protein
MSIQLPEEGTMSNLIRNLVVAAAVTVAGLSIGQTAQASPFDVLDEVGFSVELGDVGYDYDDEEWDWDDEDYEDDYDYDDEDEDDEDDDE